MKRCSGFSSGDVGFASSASPGNPEIRNTPTATTGVVVLTRLFIECPPKIGLTAMQVIVPLFEAKDVLSGTSAIR